MTYREQLDHPEAAATAVADHYRCVYRIIGVESLIHTQAYSAWIAAEHALDRLEQEMADRGAGMEDCGGIKRTTLRRERCLVVRVNQLPRSCWSEP